MIETKVPMDIRQYKAKFVGPFTTRQLVCGAIAICLDIILYFVAVEPLGIGIRAAIFLLVLVDCPILAFTIEPLGIPMETYLTSVLLKSFLAPTKRKAKDDILPSTGKTYTSKERKASKKKMKNLIKTNPEYRAFK